MCACGLPRDPSSALLLDDDGFTTATRLNKLQSDSLSFRYTYTTLIICMNNSINFGNLVIKT